MIRRIMTALGFALIVSLVVFIIASLFGVNQQYAYGASEFGFSVAIIIGVVVSRWSENSSLLGLCRKRNLAAF